MAVKACWWMMALLFLGACDGDKTPEAPGAPSTPPARTGAALGEPIAPTPDLAPRLDDAPDEVPPPIRIELPDIANEGTASEPPANEGGEAPPPIKVAPAAPRSPEAKPERRQAAVEPLEQPELDLSLPEDWTEELDASQDEASLDLLPPLFETAPSNRALQMSGRLLQDDNGDDDFGGAEINFELRR